MNQDQQTFSNKPISLTFDDFDISAESFKPINKGLGFHHDTKKTNFRPVTTIKVEKIKSLGPLNNLSSDLESRIKKQTPSGLEAFYGSTSIINNPVTISELAIADKQSNDQVINASAISQFTGWIIDLAVILSLVAVTSISLVLASGMNFQVLLKLISKTEIIIFTTTVFSLYYILYFTIVELSNSPGKIILGIRLIHTDGNTITIKNTFFRAVVSLLSIILLCLPMIIDFQGRLSDTKVVK